MIRFISLFTDRYPSYHYHYRHYSAINVHVQKQCVQILIRSITVEPWWSTVSVFCILSTITSFPFSQKFTWTLNTFLSFPNVYRLLPFLSLATFHDSLPFSYLLPVFLPPTMTHRAERKKQCDIWEQLHRSRCCWYRSKSHLNVMVDGWPWLGGITG